MTCPPHIHLPAICSPMRYQGTSDLTSSNTSHVHALGLSATQASAISQHFHRPCASSQPMIYSGTSDLTSTYQPICSVLVWWGDPMWQPPPSHLLTPHQRDGGENWKGKSQEKSLMGQDKDSLISGEVITHSRRLMPSQSLSKEHTPPSPVLLLTMMSYGVQYPFGPLGLAVLALSPPSLLAVGAE